MKRLRDLIRQGANVNARDELGVTALMKTVDATEAQLEAVRTLIAAGADVNAKNNKGETVLSLALDWVSMADPPQELSSRVSVVIALLSSKADPNLPPGALGGYLSCKRSIPTIALSLLHSSMQVQTQTG